jgi:glycosyltransferase involved in cell wall biosynthesis
MATASKKIAFVHDNFAQHGGAERVAEEIAKMIPGADMYSTVTVDQRLSRYIRSRNVQTTWMQRLPAMDRLYRYYFLLYPFAVKSMDLSAYDVIITSCVGFAKGVVRGPDALHVCYCHTPTRWIWRFEDYAVREKFSSLTGLVLKTLLKAVRRIDMHAADQPDYYIANSQAVAERIRTCYGRNAVVINPPIDVSRFHLSEEPGDYFLIVSRLVAYKRIDVAIEACNRLGKRLLIVGSGPDAERLKALAGPTVELLGRLPDAEVNQLLSRCKALLFPGEEDFGMVPIEANASGRAVIALAAGGALETVIDGQTGVLYPESTPESLAEAIRRFEEISWNPVALRRYAERFDVPVFRQTFSKVLSDLLGARLAGVAAE